jgi:hypothetical protein
VPPDVPASTAWTHARRNATAATRWILSYQPEGRRRVHFAVIAVNSIV